MQRLKTRSQFQAVLGGELVAKTSHFALHRVEFQVDAPNASAPSGAARCQLFPVDAVWLGAMAPKRWAKRAVTRNAIKRQIYSVSASLTPHLPHAAFLVRLRREFMRKDYQSASSTALKEAARNELAVLMQSALVPEKGSAAPT